MACLAAAELAAARDLYLKSVQQREVWTSLQLEAWARSRSLALGPLLGPGSEVVGDLRWAYPMDVRMVQDRGATVAVFAGGRLYQHAADSRPLALPIRVGFDPEQLSLTSDARFLAIVRRNELAGAAQAAVEVWFAPGAARSLAGSVPMQPGEWVGEHVLAVDGSAVALRLDGAAGARWVVMRTGGAVYPQPDAARIRAFGQRWSIIEGAQGLALRRDEATTRLRAMAPVAGAVAILGEDGSLKLLRADGGVLDVPLPFQPGPGPQMTAVGNWLLVHSGDGARTVAGRDELDRPIPGGEPLPPTMAWWSQPALARGQFEPAGRREAPWSPAGMRTAAFFAWKDGRAVLVDLDQEREQVIADDVGRIAWVGNHDAGQYAQVQAENSLLLLIDAAGREVLRVQGHDLRAMNWDRVAIGSDGPGGRTWSTAVLHPDPAKRQLLRLGHPPGAWPDIVIDQYDRRVVLASPTAWVELDPLTGAARQQGAVTPAGDNPPRPQADRLWFGSDGRFLRWGTRLMDKSALALARSATSVLRASDAWRVGPTTILTTLDFKAFVTPPRPGELLRLDAPAPDGWDWSWSIADQQQIVLMQSGQFKASLVQGPRLDAAVRPREGSIRDLPTGSWSIRGTEIFGMQGHWRWDDAAMGGGFRRLRAAGDRVLIVMDAAVLICGPDGLTRAMTRIR